MIIISRDEAPCTLRYMVFEEIITTTKNDLPSSPSATGARVPVTSGGIGLGV